VHVTGSVLRSFGKLDLRREVWPLNVAAARTLAADPTFWWITLLAALPVLFYTLNEQEQTLSAFSLLFSGIWALIYCYVVKGERVGWFWRISCFLFTGLLGLNGLLLVYKILPTWYVNLTESTTLSGKLCGFVAQVGVLEELAKVVPVAVLALLLRRRLNHADVVLLGLFSGLGFAAFENLSYFHNQLASNISGAVDAMTAAGNQTVSGDVAISQMASGAYATMLLPLLRSLVTPFSHAAWAGIFAHFVAVAVRPEAKGRMVALVACGLVIAATLHGLYDGLFAVQPVLPAAVAVLSFMLLRIYLVSSCGPFLENTSRESTQVTRHSDRTAPPAEVLNG
jgi:RsiW-degrading membrane proteinase PrsW (M82 family)